MLIKMSVTDFVDKLASGSPAPGGGSAAALSGAIAAGLLNMVLNLTLGKEKFEHVENDLAPLKIITETTYKRLVDLIDIDTKAFNDVIASFKLPKNSDQQKLDRLNAIQIAYKNAANIPLEIAEHCLNILSLCPEISKKGNPNSLSDSGVAAQMSYAGLEGAIMNVKINIGLIKDINYVSVIREKCITMLYEGKLLKNRVLEYVSCKI